jgi:hypothetical protein
MTVANNYKPIKQVGNGNTTSFSFDFPVITESEVEVYQNIDGVESLVDNNSYTITLNSNGGVIDFATAPAQGVVVAIVRNVDLTQETPFLTSSGFPADRVEDCFDKLTMITQQQQQVLDRCVKVEVTDDQKPEELIDKVFEQLDLATTTGEAAIAAAEQAKEAATSAQILSETAKQTIETETANSITTINQHSVGILSTMERYATQTQENANIAQNAVNTLPDYLGQIEATTEEGIKKLQANGAFNHAVVDALPETIDENKFYFIKE